MFRALLFLAAITGGVVCQHPNDPCALVVNGNHHETVANIHAICQNGSIWWEYPQGTMKANFHSSDATTPYTVCLSDVNGLVQRAEVLTISDVSNHGSIPLSTGAKVVCTNRHTGTISLQFTGPSHADKYIAFIDYQMKP